MEAKELFNQKLGKVECDKCESGIMHGVRFEELELKSSNDIKVILTECDKCENAQHYSFEVVKELKND